MKDLLKNDQVTPDMLKDLGMNSKEELNQFVKKFEKAPKSEPGAGREIDVKPGKERAVDPNRKLPDLNLGARTDTTTIRNRGGYVQDTLRGNNEGVRFDPPPELRAGFNAYRKSLSRTKAATPPPRPAAPGTASGAGGK